MIGNITLVGFMGTGKSAVGRRLAEALGREFVDMDAVLEARQGLPVARIFAVKGEEFFRGLERELVAELAARRGLVIAAGGGVVLNPANLRQLSAAGPVICLTAAPATILSRLGDGRTRPLLADDDPSQVARKIETLLAQRQAAYAAVPWQVATDGLTAAAVARRILRELPAATITGRSTPPPARPGS